MSTTTTLTTSAAISQYWEKEALKKLTAETPLYGTAWKKSIPNGNGLALNFIRFNLATADVTPAVQGAPVAPETLNGNLVQATMQQYVSAVAFSDVLDETNFVQGGMEEAALEYITQKMKYSVQALLQAEVTSSCTTAGSNLYAPLTVSGGAIGSIVAADVLKAGDLRRAWGILANRNVPKYGGEKFVGHLHTASAYDIKSQTSAGEYLDVMKRTESGIGNIKKGLIGDIFGLSLYESSLMPTANDGSGSIKVYRNFFHGEESLGFSELSSQKMKIIRKRGGSSTNTYDLADQIGGSVAYKFVACAKNMSDSPVTSTNQRVIVIGAASAL
jgi:N4-gp56 family major capsid protein